ncbi:hypothetical protein K488DRAFT_75497 [Vararia minispora EC-137]|uniref:Uncharacterized protein n=1 Tax=Vararia minispora EC-137 TaxID=1314806 RepID=A0ACB8QZF2_9AGAM|nr:hypothetical protein K488DRAFT_75497 [Vararia minispora EC-137]
MTGKLGLERADNPPPPQPVPYDLTIDAILQKVVLLSTAQEYVQLAAGLRESQGRESVFLQMSSSGQDPLRMLDPTVHTLGMLYIMTARLLAPQHLAPAVSFDMVLEFCRRFDPLQARLAPERVTAFAIGIVQAAEGYDIKTAIGPLVDLLTRYAPDLTHLTTIHQHLLVACVSSQHYTPALPIISTPISTISLALCPDLTYNDHVVYHYTAGVAAAALRKWNLAADLLETCASAPASAVQIDAMKKLVLVQLVQHGQLRAVAKYTHGSVARTANQSSPYGAFARAYPSQMASMQQIVEKERALFIADGNMGLVKLALARAPRWTIKKLTETYLTLGLAEIGRAAGIEDVEEVRRMVLSMIDAGEINATISADGTVAFADDPPVRVSKAEMDAVLARAQKQEKALAALERETARSREYLSKAVRNRDEGGAAGWMQADDTEWGNTGWNEEAFANL